MVFGVRRGLGLVLDMFFEGGAGQSILLSDMLWFLALLVASLSLSFIKRKPAL